VRAKKRLRLVSLAPAPPVRAKKRLRLVSLAPAPPVRAKKRLRPVSLAPVRRCEQRRGYAPYLSHRLAGASKEEATPQGRKR
jgi:hypothetical protein